MELLAHGETNRQIADRIVVSEGTVKSHVSQILRKMHAANRAEAVSKFIRLTSQ
jgi:DNA-binding NarL/FixJ family response regulator